MDLSTLKERDFVQLKLQDGSQTLAQVVALNNDRKTVELRIKGQIDHIILNWSIPKVENHISDVPISESLLSTLGFIKDKGWLYALPEEEFWQKNLTRNGVTFYEILKNEQGDWVSVESKCDADGCKFISVGCIRLYQKYFKNKYGIDFPQSIIERLFKD